MSTVFKKAAHRIPVDFSAVETEWRREGFSFGVFRDPPRQEWNDFTHSSDEYVLVAEGQLEVDVGNETAICGPGDLVCIPRQARCIRTGERKLLSFSWGCWLRAVTTGKDALLLLTFSGEWKQRRVQILFSMN